MNKFILAAGLATSMVLTACEAEPEAVNADAEAGPSIQTERAEPITISRPQVQCPANKIISEASIFEADLPNPKLNETAWFEANGQREGVITRESGLQYSIVQNGLEIAPSPSGAEKVRVNYQGSYRDGKVFDSSFVRREPNLFPVNSVVRGWSEGLRLMKPCDAWTFYIPSHLAFGDTPPKGILPNEPVIYHAQLIDVKLKRQ